MNITAIKTRLLNPPQDDLITVIKESVLTIPENSIFVITSKVVSIWEGRCVPIGSIEKDALIKSEAEQYIERDEVPGRLGILTLKNGVLSASAGVDESKRAGCYILLPKDAHASAKKLHSLLQAHFGTKNFGILITDSRTLPLRRGVLGISIGHHGFNPIKDYRDIKELQDKNYSITQSNVADGLAAAAVVVMGEGPERTPLAMITDIPFANFIDTTPDLSREFSSFEVPPEEDLYYPLLKNAPWKQK